MLTPPRYSPNTQASRIPWRAVQNRFAEGPNDEKSLRLAPGKLDWAFSEFDMDFSYGPEYDRYTIVQEFSEGKVGNKHYAFIPSRLQNRRNYRNVFESSLHTTGTRIFYRWWIEKINAGEKNLIPGDIHSFVNPRKISIAMLGDSFGSGEGASGRHASLPKPSPPAIRHRRSWSWRGRRASALARRRRCSPASLPPSRRSSGLRPISRASCAPPTLGARTSAPACAS